METKKHFAFIILIFAGISYLYGIEIYNGNYIGMIQINDTMIKYTYEDPEMPIEEYNITWEIINGLRYLSFYYNGTFLNTYNRIVPHGIKRYLVIYDSWYLIFYNENNNVEFFKSGIRDSPDIAGGGITTVSATSELKENNYVYSAQNLFRSSLIPWVEGVQGSGIGEKIRIEVTQNYRRNSFDHYIMRSIFISNGFLDYNRPHLYENNNRLKKIRVHNIGYDEYVDLEVADHPDFQRLYFRFQNPCYAIEIEILEVYRGSRWDDTCVNIIFPSNY